MKEIQTAEEFKTVIAESRALVMVHGEWSGPSQKSLAHIERWLASPDNAALKNRVPAFCVLLPTMTHDFLTEWVDQNPLAQVRNDLGEITHLACAGPLSWVIAGKVIAFEYRPYDLSLAELNEITCKAFGLKTA